MSPLLWHEAVYYDASATMSEAVRTMMQMSAEAAQESAAQADAGFLWDFWYPAARSTEIRGRSLRRRCSWKCRWCLAGPPRGKCLRCEILVRIAGFRCRTGGWTGKWWSAVITDGGSMLARDSAWRFRRCPARTS